MQQFMTIHRAPGLTKEQIVAEASAILEGKHARFVQNFVNLFDGFMITVYEAKDRDALEREFERLGFPFDEIHEIEFTLIHAGLRRTT